MAARAKPETGETQYSKDQLLASDKFVKNHDLLAAMLNDGQRYTIRETEAIVDKFMKRKVV